MTKQSDPTPRSSEAGRGPLATLRVIEFSGIGPGPLAGQLLGDLGADVVVIDRASGNVDPTDVNRRGKRSAALNLQVPAGVEAARLLLADADVLIEGFRPGVMERLGLGPDPCLSANPKLVYARITGWGQTGPLSQAAGHDINYLALTGALHAIGKSDSPPIPPLNLVADFGGGTMFLLLGILTALFERSRSGRGQVIDAAMVDGVPAMMGLIHMLVARGQWSDRRESNLLDGGAPFYRSYETADGKYIAVGAIEQPFFRKLLQLAGLPPEDAERQNDAMQWPELHARFEALFRMRTRDEWAQVFEGSDACVAPILTLGEAAMHPHQAARGVFFERGGVVQASPAPRFSRSAPARPEPPRPAGADTESVLSESGATGEMIEQLRAQGAIV